MALSLTITTYSMQFLLFKSSIGMATHSLCFTFLQMVSHKDTNQPSLKIPDDRIIFITQASFLIHHINWAYTLIIFLIENEI